MKPISAYLGTPKERYTRKFAWWPVRSFWSKKLIWLKNYVELEMFYDESGRPPLTNISWKWIYTENEYLLMLLRKDETKIY
jgi:hypothetical protein